MTELLPLVLPALAAGAVNSIAGGGTLLTFPALLAIGLPPVTANATSSLSLVPGSLASWWGYRGGLEGTRRTLVALGLPSLVGGGAGALLLMATGDELFGRIVPWLILGATLLFVLQDRLARKKTRTASLGAIATLQFLLSVYGGFFGAGMGILMLAVHGYLGMTDVHQLNSVKSFCAVCINGVAIITFIALGRVRWAPGLVMAAAAVIGGYAGARLARRVPQRFVRGAIAVIGFAIAGFMFWKQLG